MAVLQLTTDPTSTGSPEIATFNLDGNDITIELKQNYAQLAGNDFTFNVQNITIHDTNVLSVDDARIAITPSMVRLPSEKGNGK